MSSPRHTSIRCLRPWLPKRDRGSRYLRRLFAEHLEDRRLLAVIHDEIKDGPLMSALGSHTALSGEQSVFAGISQNQVDLAVQSLTTTGSPTEFSYLQKEDVVWGAGPNTAQSGPQIRLDAFRNDPRFAGIDGSGFATVIIDSGLDLDHPFFGPDVAPADGIADRIAFSFDFYGPNDADASDFYGHGSNVSSIVASSDSTHTGMAPGADIIHLKVFPDAPGGAPTYDIEEALQWVVANAATFNIASVNLSLGSANAQTLQAGPLYDEFAALAGLSVIPTVASGNGFFTEGSTQGVNWIAANPNAISVGAVYDANIGRFGYSSGAIATTTGVDRITPFTQRHSELLDILAPGAAITGANQEGATVTYHGTSQASPHIAGIAVLAQQLAVQELGRRLTLDEFRGLLQSTAVILNDGDDEDDNVINTGLDFPRVDVFALGEAILDLKTATVSGRVFDDQNGDGSGSGEPGLAGWTVYLDDNDNSSLDSGVDTHNATDVPVTISSIGTPAIQSKHTVSGVPGVITDVDVTLDISHTYNSDVYAYLMAPDGTRVELFSAIGGNSDNFTNTTLDDEAATTIANASAPFTGVFQPEGLLSLFDGRDPNGEWTLDIGDAFTVDGGSLNSWSIRISYAEQSQSTPASGNYAFSHLPAGTHIIRQMGQSGFTQTAPAGGFHTAVVTAGQILTGRDFGNHSGGFAGDYGDAPSPFPVTLVHDGARHVAVGPTLGTWRDDEADGTNSAAANFDDNHGGAPDDEDGVTVGMIMVGALDALVTVNVQGAPGKLDAWIDFNGDGSWGGPGEHVFDSVDVSVGDNVLHFDVPVFAVEGATYARFRLSTAGNLGVSGAAADGEVEDYQVTIASPAKATGLFSEENTIDPGAANARSVFGADIDGDGDMDALVASHDDDTITWYANDGAGHFTAHVVTTTAQGAHSVFAADADGDGDMDVFSASRLDNTIAWYENDGDQNFTARDVTNSAGNAASVFVVDLDGDGDTDVLSASHSLNTIAWYENDGSQSFVAHTITTSAAWAISVFAVDVDRDGDMDVLSASSDDDTIAWYENDGHQNFVAHTISNTAEGAHSVFATDLDHDGDTDVLSASTDDNSIRWYENDGDENFSVHVITADAMGARSVFAADMDGDGDLDVLRASFADHTITWYENDGNENFVAREITTSALGAWSVFPADIDDDGDLDVLGAAALGGTIGWYENLYSVSADTTPPEVSVVVPELTNDTTPPLTVTASDNIPLPNGTVVHVDVDLDGNGSFDDAGERGYASAALTEGMVTLELTPPLAYGTYALRARLLDLAGNEGTSDVATVRVDRVIITGITVDAGLSDSDGITNDANLIIHGVASPTDLIEVFVDQALVGMVLADASGDWEIDYTEVNLLEGRHSLTARASGTNLALNISRAGFPSPLESDHGHGVATDPWDLVDGLRIYDASEHGVAFTGGFTVAGGEPAGPRQAVIDFGAPLEMDQIVLWHAGTVHTPASAKIEYGIVTDGETEWFELDTERYQREIIETAWVDVPFQPDPYQLWSGSDRYTFAPVTAHKIRYSFDNREESVLGGQMSHGWLYQFDVFLRSEVSAPLVVEIDTTSPGVTLSVPELTNDQTPTVTVTATDNIPLPDGTVVHVDVDLNGNGNFDDAGERGYAVGEMVNGTVTMDFTPSLPYGTYALRARLLDLAGNEGTSDVTSVRIDRVVITNAIVNTGGNDAQGNPISPSLTVTGVAVPGDIVEVYADGAFVGVARTDDAGDWTLAYTANEPFPRIHTFIARASGENVARNLNREGVPTPLESDPGHGVATNLWDLVDGVRIYDAFEHGVAFTGGFPSSGGEPAGPRQAVIDFGALTTFDQVVLWHAGTVHTPVSAKIEYGIVTDGETEWFELDTLRYLLEIVEIAWIDVNNQPEQYRLWSGSDRYTFAPVTAHKVRYSFDNREDSLDGGQMSHGWLYQFDVFRRAELSAPYEATTDFGDAPPRYGVTRAEDGAFHYSIGPTLGATRDAEFDGTHSALADDDDTLGVTPTDEDGVTFGAMRPGAEGATLQVNVQGGPAKLDAWIDFNGDGSWDGPGEQIFDSVDVAVGDNVLHYDIPAAALPGTTYARFRLSTEGDLAPGGAAADGEVEDYLVTIATVGVELIAVATPSAAGSTSLPTPIQSVGTGDTYFVEVWVQEYQPGITGIAGGHVDIIFDPGISQVEQFFHQDFDQVPTGSLDNGAGRLNDFGGGTLTAGRGDTPGWARLGYLEVLATGFGIQTIRLEPATFQFALWDAGTVDWTDVDLSSESEVEIELAAQVHYSISRVPATTSANGERSTVPSSVTGVHEWDRFVVELWGNTRGTNVDIQSARFTLPYNTSITTAVELEPGPGFTLTAGSLDDVNGLVANVLLTANESGLGDGEAVLLARIFFEPVGADQAVVDEVGRLAGPYDLGFGLIDAEISVEGFDAAPAIGDAPNVQLWPVIYDIDDNNAIDFGDFSYFAPAFGREVGTETRPFTWWADFDGSGLVDFGDFAFFTPNFAQVRLSATILFPPGHPANIAPASGEGEYASTSAGGDQAVPDMSFFDTPRGRELLAALHSLGPFQNSIEPLDINNDRAITPLDALVAINVLNGASPRFVFLDANGDNQVTPQDVLLVINKLNEEPGDSFVAEGETNARLRLETPALAHPALASDRDFGKRQATARTFRSAVSAPTAIGLEDTATLDVAASRAVAAHRFTRHELTEVDMEETFDGVLDDVLDLIAQDVAPKLDTNLNRE